MIPIQMVRWLSVITAIGIATSAATANAAPSEFSIILLDRTGSMSTVTVGTATRWTDALDHAISVVQLKDTADTTVDRAYAIWDFRLGAGTAGPLDQDNAIQVWPRTAADCTCPATVPLCFISQATSVAGVTNNFCDFGNRNNAAQYNALVTLLEGYKTDPNRTPDPAFNGRTPLSDSLCRILNQVGLTGTTTAQTITFESDGLENNSADGVCGNFLEASTNAAFVSDPNFVWQKSISDWGMSNTLGSGTPDAVPAGSWEARIVRRALRLTTPTIGVAVTNNPIVANETASTNLAWRVGVHYTTFDGTQPLPLALVSPAPAAATLAVASGNTSDKGGTSVPQFKVSAFAAGVSLSAATTATVTLSIPQAELSLFKSLGSPTFPSKGNGASRSSFQGITVLPGQVFGTNHKLAGDVDDSGCTDRADFNIMMQRDVWMQRAVPPLQIAMRADLNKDGWVNKADRTILLAHWGEGCLNSPGPKPSI